MKQSNKPDSQFLAEGILQGNRVILGRAITLIESNLEEDKKLSIELLEKIIHATGNSIRLGITGVPGVGKSTFIETLGKHILGKQKKLAVLTVDPSSQFTKGSILGDKTRMEELSKSPLAYIRPSPAGTTLGGIAHKTHDVVLLCEAAGHEVIIVETVGVGQSEVAVKNCVDFFLLLMLAGAGDELQGLKKGIMEMAHAIAITKADGDNIKSATAAQAIYQQAFHFLPSNASDWVPKVIITSAQTGLGIEEVWKMILSFKEEGMRSGIMQKNRRNQTITWFNDAFLHLLNSDLLSFKDLQVEKKKLEGEVNAQKISVELAAEEFLKAYYRTIIKSKNH